MMISETAKDKLTIVYIDRNNIDPRYPNSPEDGDRMFTYGWGSEMAREFKKYNPDFNVECWKADPRIDKIMEKKIQDVNYRMFPSWNFGRLGQYSKPMIHYLKKWQQSNLNTVYNISSFNHLLFYSIALKMKHFPFVVQNHGESTARYKVATKKGLRKFYWTLHLPVEKWCFSRIDILFLLDARLQQWLPKTRKKTDLIVRTVGVNENIFPPLGKTDAKTALGFDLNQKYLLYVGRLNYTKRPDILIEIYDELKKERNDVKLILAGHEKTDPLYNAAKDSGALLYGVIPQTELYKYLSAAEVYILPAYSVNHAFGGIGMLPVQAMLCNTPVVGSSLLNFPESYRGEVGLVATNHKEIKDAILGVLDGKVRFENLRELAIMNYSWESICKNTARDYRTIFKFYKN